MDITNILKQLLNMNEEDRIAEINDIKRQLHSISPFKSEPVDCVLWVKAEDVVANDYNPNKVAPPEMELLYDSIKNDGYTQPVVTGTPIDTESIENKYIVTDGYHRNLIPRRHRDIQKRLKGYLPITVIEGKTRSELMASTIRHNRARGTHDVDLMSNIVAEIHDLGRSDEWISKHLGMDIDEILRLKQITGLASLFKDQDFSMSWEPGEE